MNENLLNSIAKKLIRDIAEEQLFCSKGNVYALVRNALKDAYNAAKLEIKNEL